MPMESYAKIPKDKDSGDFDYSRAPSLKLKLQYWDEEFKNIEVYNKERVMIYPSDENTFVPDLITKGTIFQQLFSVEFG